MPQPCYRSLDLQAVKSGALTTLLPELHDLQEVKERNDWHTDDGFQQSLRLFRWVDELPTPLLTQVGGENLILHNILSALVDVEYGHHTVKDALRFVALIHDIGKKETLEMSVDGTTRCPDHEAIGARMAPGICARFDLTLAETHFITTLVGTHGEAYALFKEIAPLPVPEQQAQIRRFEVEHAAHLLPLLLLACGDLVTSQLKVNRPEKYGALLEFYRRLIRSALQREVARRTDGAESC